MRMARSGDRRTFLTGMSFCAGANLVNFANAASPQPHVVLLGDSILDNKPYVGERPCVIEQVQTVLGNKAQATLLAVDGSTTDDLFDQIRNLPASTTHVFISTGGNDALARQDVLMRKVDIVGEALHELYQIQADFGKKYRAMLEAALAKVPNVAVCTIYDPNFPEAVRQQVSVAALASFNDRITREAFSKGVPLIDLRLLFSNKDDYANPIEPSTKGGQKIAQVIAKIVNHHDFSQKQSRVYDRV